MFTVYPGKMDWNMTQTWLQANGYPIQPAVWNVYCNGDSTECAISKQAAGTLMFPQFTWMASWRGENTASQLTALGTGTANTYNGIDFQVEGVALKANAEQAVDSIDLSGENAKAVHVLEFAGWSIAGVNIAEWAYDRTEN